jgi:hypothetical protein
MLNPVKVVVLNGVHNLAIYHSIARQCSPIKAINESDKKTYFFGFNIFLCLTVTAFDAEENKLFVQPLVQIFQFQVNSNFVRIQI